MKLLFDRLDSHGCDSVADLVEESLDRIVAVQYLSDRDAPPGILNFGLPRAIDISHIPNWQERYACLVEERISQFEPRLAHVRAKLEGETVSVKATLLGQEQTEFSWNAGG